MGTGTVLYGINNIFTLRSGEDLLECRIKGKTLKDAEREHNPLAPGDRVTFEPDTHVPHSGLITARLERYNAFTRWNRKTQRFQTIAVNIDLIVCVSSTDSPPFRPRFLDRVSVEAERIAVPLLILLNKADLGVSEDTERRISDFQRIGYLVIRCSARTGEGITDISGEIGEKHAVFFGQSGVGKSTLLNALYPGLGLKTGDISRKSNQGTHTTVYSLMIPRGGGAITDTPGIREMEIRGIDPSELGYLFREFREHIPLCPLRKCRHVDEPGCAVREAVHRGIIHPDRYESYKSTLSSMEEEEYTVFR